MSELSFDINELVAVLNKSPHRDLTEYIPIATKAMQGDKAFFHHFIAWNHIKGQIRDAKVALPVLGLLNTREPEFVANSYGHLMSLSPRELKRALDFAKGYQHSLSPNGIKWRGFSWRGLGRMVEAYLRDKERVPAKLERTVLQHRKVLRGLYTQFHVKPSPLAAAMLGFELTGEVLPEVGGVLSKLGEISKMDPVTAAGMVMHYKIPFLIATSVMPQIKGNRTAIIAIIQSMSASDLVNQVKNLKHWGMDKDPAIKAAYAEALAKSKGNANLFKAAKAVEVVEEEDVREALAEIQERKLGAGSIDGNWLVLADMSGSMSLSMELGKKISAILSRMVTGKIWLVFFNQKAYGRDVTGKTLEGIREITGQLFSHGYTSIGAGLDFANSQGLDFDGIAVVSDGGHNKAPQFSTEYAKAERRLLKSPSVYFYRVGGDQDKFSTELDIAGIAYERFPVDKNADEYSIANLVQTMRVNRYSLYQEIMDTPLKTFVPAGRALVTV